MTNTQVDAIKSSKKSLLTTYIEEYLNENDTLFTKNADVMVILDLLGNLVKVNPAFVELSGFSVDGGSQLSFHSLIVTEELDKYFNYFQKTTRGQFFNFDSKIRNSMGEVTDLNMMFLPISVEDQIVGIQIVARDITQLKRKKAEVRKIEEYHRVLTDNMLDIIITTNETGTILYVSPSCERILGYATDEIVGQHLSTILESVEDTVLLNHQLHPATPAPHREANQFRKKDGSLVMMESITKPIIDQETENIVEVVSMHRCR
jgi:two-component system sporulation sensor kinase A